MMLTDLSLRLRVFLFFCLLGLGGAAIVLVAGYLGYMRLGSVGAPSAFVFAAIIAVLGILGMTAGVWLLFDENVAKPIERLAAEMRARAHAGVGRDMDTHAARYLGDLAPAAAAVTRELTQSTFSTAETIAQETARLAAEKERLTALLTEIPVAMILVNPAHKIVLYDGQSADVLARAAPPRLMASIFDYLDEAAVMKAWTKLAKTGRDVAFEAPSVKGDFTYSARLKPLGDAPGYMLVIDDSHLDIAPEAARPLVYDFDLLELSESGEEDDKPLSDLSFVVFDSETTGLLPHKDEVVQLGAVRIVKGRIVPGEEIDTLVNPGCPIPAASTKVHKVTDAMVADAPDILDTGRRFHAFCRDAVIVAHNAPFDMAFLHRDAEKMGVRWDHPILDTVLLSAVLFGASETHTLDALCERLGVVIPENLRHTALGDARATAEVLCRMLPMLEARGLTTFGTVITETRKHGRLLEDLN